jgi:hypothetical protein
MVEFTSAIHTELVKQQPRKLIKALLLTTTAFATLTSGLLGQTSATAQTVPNTQPPGLRLYNLPANITLKPGELFTTALSVEPFGGLTDPITVRATSSQPDVSATVTPFSGDYILRVQPSPTAYGFGSLTVTAISGSVVLVAVIDFQVLTIGRYHLLTPATIYGIPGQTVKFPVTAVRDSGYNGIVFWRLPFDVTPATVLSQWASGNGDDTFAVQWLINDTAVPGETDVDFVANADIDGIVGHSKLIVLSTPSWSVETPTLVVSTGSPSRASTASNNSNSISFKLQNGNEYEQVGTPRFSNFHVPRGAYLANVTGSGEDWSFNFALQDVPIGTYPISFDATIANSTKTINATLVVRASRIRIRA